MHLNNVEPTRQITMYDYSNCAMTSENETTLCMARFLHWNERIITWYKNGRTIFYFTATIQIDNNCPHENLHRRTKQYPSGKSTWQSREWFKYHSICLKFICNFGVVSRLYSGVWHVICFWLNILLTSTSWHNIRFGLIICTLEKLFICETLKSTSWIQLIKSESKMFLASTSFCIQPHACTFSMITVLNACWKLRSI